MNADLIKQLDSFNHGNGLPPVDKWNPEFCSDIDIKIDEKGNWYHEGGLIKRDKLVFLFASVLKKEKDEYYLVTPVEKLRIQVVDVPLFVIDVEFSRVDDLPIITFTTKTGDVIVLSESHPLRVIVDEVTGEPHPYVLVRGGMEAKLSRNVFYELVNHAEARSDKLAVCSNNLI